MPPVAIMITDEISSWKKGDRVVVRTEPEHGPGTIDGDALIVTAGRSRVRFWPVLFDDLSEKMIEETTLAPAPPEAPHHHRYDAGAVVRTHGAVSGTILEVGEADGRTRYRIEAWIDEAELGSTEERDPRAQRR